MLNNPALSDPRTVLHALNYKAAFVCLAALFMPDCRPPVDREWLSLRTGVKSLTTISYSMKHLVNLGLVYHTVSGWFLTDGAKQLPLPFAQLQPRSQAAPLPRSQGVNGSSTSLAPSYPQAVDNSRAQGNYPAPGTQPAATGEYKMNGRFPEARSFCTADQDKDACLFVVNASLEEITNKQTNKQEAAAPFKTNSTRDFLTSIHMLHGVPDRFAHVPLPVVLAYWWHINTWATNNPQGSLYRRLSQGHNTPPADYLRLAQVWLAMDGDDRAELREAAGGTQNGVYHPPVANGRQFRFQLGDDFYPELDATALDAYLYLLANAPEEVVTPCPNP